MLRTVTVLIGLLLSGSGFIVGGVVALLAYTGFLPTASNAPVEASVGTQNIGAAVTTGNVALVICIVSAVLFGLVYWRVPKMTQVTENEYQQMRQ